MMPTAQGRAPVQSSLQVTEKPDEEALYNPTPRAEVDDRLRALHGDGQIGSVDGNVIDSTTPETVPNDELQRASTDNEPYSTFTRRQKVFIVITATLGSCFSPFTTNIYFPAIDTIAKSLDVSVSQVNLSITTYMICQAVAPSFISAISDVRGRRPGYVIGFVFYVAANLGLALNNSYAGLIILRCIQSCGSSGMVTLSQGTIADVVTSAERGKYIAITGAASVLAPSIAPIVGGVLAEYLGWHSIFWFLLIASGVFFIPLLLFFPETGRNIVGNGSVPPSKWNRTLLDLRPRDHCREDNTAEKDTDGPQPTVPAQLAPTKRKQPINPLASLMLLRDPETLILLAFMSAFYAMFYAVSTSITVQCGRIYGLSSTLQGLLFLPQAGGAILAVVTNSKIVDANYRRWARKTGVSLDKKKQINILTSKMPIERARLELAIPFITMPIVLVLVYGWLLEAKVSIAGPIVLLVFSGYGVLAGFSLLSLLLIDLHRGTPAIASAASNLTRCLCGAGAAALVNPMIDAWGNGWTFTFWSVLAALFLPCLVYVCFRGPQMRAARLARESKRQTVKDARKLQAGKQATADHQWRKMFRR